MKKLIYLIAIVSITSCMTESKVSRYMSKHREYAANKCAEMFPFQETSDSSVTYDSTDYFAFYNNAIITIDSLVAYLEDMKVKCKQAGKPIAINIDSIRTEIKKAMTPCITKEKIITITKKDTRELEALAFKLNKYRADVESLIIKYEKERDKRIAAEDKLHDAKKKIATLITLLIIVIILSLIIIFRKLIAPVVTGGASLITKLFKLFL